MIRDATRIRRRGRKRSAGAGNRGGDADISLVVAQDAIDPRRGTAVGRVLDDDTTVIDGGGIDDLDASNAAVRKRAREALLTACDGWRARRRCTAPDGTRVAHPHPECLAAQYRHELILLENGVPR
jgi:hypothetical protein